MARCPSCEPTTPKLLKGMQTQNHRKSSIGPQPALIHRLTPLLKDGTPYPSLDAAAQVLLLCYGN